MVIFSTRPYFRLIILSGCSSGGKSTLLAELAKRGYTVVPEVGREIVKEELAAKSGIIPWEKPTEFCELLIGRSVGAYEAAKGLSVAKENVIFFDRSFLDGVAYYQSLQGEDPHRYDSLAVNLRFDATLFMVPPWKELFCSDEERRHTFEEAVSEYERLMKFYPKQGYTLVEVPKMSVEERADWVLNQLGLGSFRFGRYSSSAQ